MTIVKVPSETTPGTTYDVIVDSTGQAHSCGCKARQFNAGKSCKHMAATTAAAAQLQHLAAKGRFQVGPVNWRTMDAIYASVRANTPPTDADVATLARIVGSLLDTPDASVERRVLGGLLALLTAPIAAIVKAA